MIVNGCDIKHSHFLPATSSLHFMIERSSTEWIPRRFVQYVRH
jgi:hypothetical protein